MRATTWRIAATVTAILAALALVACGDDGGTSARERTDYAQRVNEAQTTFASTVATVASGTSTATSISRQQRTLRRFEAAINGVVADLRAIKPPSEVTAEHKRLTAVLEDFGRDIAEANAAMRNPTPQSLGAAKARVRTATQSVNARVNAAIAAINAKLHQT